MVEQLFDAILKRAKSGDTDALSYLYQYSFSSVFGRIYKEVSNKQVAEDLTSEVFLTMIKSIHALRSSNEAGFRAWICKIADTTIAQYYRDCEKIVTYTFVPSIDTSYVMEERSEILEAFRTLTEEQRLALSGKFVYGYTASELAQLLGKGTDAIRALQCRAAKSLKHNLSRRNLAAKSFIVLLCLLGSLIGISYIIKIAHPSNKAHMIRFLEKRLGHLYYQEKKHHYPPPVSTSTPSIRPKTTSTSITTPTSSDATIQNPTPTPTSTPSGAIRISGVCIAGLCLST